MKQVTLRNENAAARFIRSYMAANEITSLNLVEKEQGLLNHGHGARGRDLANAVCHIPVDLRGHKPQQVDRGLTFQPFASVL